MALDSSIVGSECEPVTSEIDARWTMAYAAGLLDPLSDYTDTRRGCGIVTHPVFPVCFEWTAVLRLAGKLAGMLSPTEASRGVHATHDLTIHRPIAPPERLTTWSAVVGVERRKPGAYMTSRFETVDQSGAPVCTTWMGTVYRGVEVTGPDRQIAPAPASPIAASVETTPLATVRVALAAGSAHVYSECARIWNPIHTDVAVAAAAGLPATILHGTATLGFAISRVVESEANGDPTRVQRIGGRFAAMVLTPSEITVRVLAREQVASERLVAFDVRNGEGQPAIRHGFVILR